MFEPEVDVLIGKRRATDIDHDTEHDVRSCLTHVQPRSLGRVTFCSFLRLIGLSSKLLRRILDVLVHVLHDIGGYFVELSKLHGSETVRIVQAPGLLLLVIHSHGFTLNVHHVLDDLLGDLALVSSVA